MTKEELAIRVLKATGFDWTGNLFWRSDHEYAPITMFVNCNDLFYWGCADAEEITEENIGLLEEALVVDNTYGADLFCARSRKMRPQQPCYKGYSEEIKKLFDACGPERTRESEG